ncbi:MAG: ExbD/TolR family protein [Planctomycetota bacterium]
MSSAVVSEQQEVKAEMSFAPMIDVVFQLLIFFLVCSRVKQTEDKMDCWLDSQGLSIQPPSLDPPEPIYVLVKDDEALRSAPSALEKSMRGATYYIQSTDGVGYRDLNQLREALKSLLLHPDTPLIIYPADERTRRDQETPWKNVLGVVDAGYWAGYRSIQFRPPQQILW